MPAPCTHLYSFLKYVLAQKKGAAVHGQFILFLIFIHRPQARSPDPCVVLGLGAFLWILFIPFLRQQPRFTDAFGNELPIVDLPAAYTHSFAVSHFCFCGLYQLAEASVWCIFFKGAFVLLCVLRRRSRDPSPD